ncbi:MAG: YigZ family protein [Clostridia bacterium]|nr:YigZ family protein [Clostridia bacterium]
MAADRYLTIARAAVDEFVEKRSRFIGAIQPVTTEEEALAFIRARQKQYWDATHNVYAYVLNGGNLCRFSDDGEPQGTAGIPVLDVLRKEGLTDCAVVVTRYFGGILLGGGGLVRAYSHGAKIAVDAGGVVEMRLCLQGAVTCDYSQYGWVPAFLTDAGATVTDTQFGEAVDVYFSLPQEKRAHLKTTLIDRSNGRLEAVFTGEEWAPFPVERK